MSQLTIKYGAVEDDMTILRLGGVINEDNDLAGTTDNVSTSKIIIDTGDIERINSCGVRDWVNWLESLHDKGCQAFFIECSPAIMTQVNLVNNFLGNGQILSFYAPFFCPACEADKMLLINVDDALKQKPLRAPSCRCDQCDHSMEFDDIESSYFAFLDTLSQPSIDAAVMSVARKASQASGLLRSRSMSLQLPALSATPSSPSNPTTPGSRELQGLLTSVSNVESSPLSASSPPRQPGSAIILYLIATMLFVAIGLLAYVVLRS